MTEKVDGSFFAFGLHSEAVATDQGQHGFTEQRLRIRSKGAEMYIEAPEKMFNKAAETVKSLSDKLTPGWTYRGEYLAKPKHNSLAYDRVPNGYIILFDILTGPETFLSYDEVAAEAKRLGLEVVPRLLDRTPTEDELRSLIDNTVSILGGQKIEGVVIKQKVPTLFGADKKALMMKFVSERFREIHKQEWKKENPSTSDVVDHITEMVSGPARWEKAVQHLKEAGKIKGVVQDIGLVMKELPADVEKECKEIILDELWEHFWPKIRRTLGRGFPDYYKEQLLKEQYNNDATDETNVAEVTPER